MRTAIFLYGQYRHADTALPLWVGFNELDADYYVATWDYTKQVVNDTDYKTELFRHEREITPDDVYKFIPDATLFIDDEYKYNFRNNHEKMSFLHKKCLEMCVESGKKYDIVLVMRIDSIYQCTREQIDTLSHVKKNTLYFSNGLSYVQDMNNKNQIKPIPFINDLFFYGDFDTINKFITSLPYTLDGTHNTYAKVAIMQKIHIRDAIGVTMAFLRPFHIDILKFYNLRPNSPLSSDLINELQEVKNKYEEYIELTHYDKK